MPEYLVECYLARRADLADVVARARRAAAAVSRRGTAVRHVRATFLPDDEVCLHVFSASSLDAVQAAAMRAALDADRIVEARELDHEPEPGRRTTS